MYLFYCNMTNILKLKGNKTLLSLGQIVMQTILAPIFFEFFLWQVFFLLMLTKEYVFVLRNFPLLHKLKKEDDLTFASYLHMLDLCQHLLSQTKLS